MDRVIENILLVIICTVLLAMVCAGSTRFVNETSPLLVGLTNKDEVTIKFNVVY